jgi:hypothetical protein
MTEHPAPDPRQPSDPIESALRAVAQGLAGRPFAVWNEYLRELGEWVRRTVPTEDGDRVARGLVDEIREMVEDVLRSEEANAASSTRPQAGSDPAELPFAEPDPLPPPLPSVNAVAVPARPRTPAVAPTRATVAVETPAGFATVTLDEALRQAGEVTMAYVREWLANPENANRFLFDGCRDECPEVAIVRDPAVVPKALWVVGDIHADVLTLANVIAHADREAAAEGVPASFLFLGDFVDRGRYDHETLLLLFRLLLRDPGRVCIIPGNHDVDLKWEAGRFRVSIEPAEYCERLNAHLTRDPIAARDEIELAKLLIDFWQKRPKAVLLPDGTMFSHGGFPHTDLHAALRVPEDLGDKRCLDDFLWARLAESPKKRPNRGNRGHEFGWKDFAQFCRLMREVVKVDVSRLVRGHDHVPARWLLPPEYAEFPVLTINAMGRRMEGEPDPLDGPHPYPVLGRHVVGALPRLVRLPLDLAEVERALGKEHVRPTPAATQPAEPPFDDFPGGVEVDVPPKTRPPADTARGGGV